MDKRQARRLARSVTAQILSREIHNHGLVDAIAENQQLSDREYQRLWNAFQDILSTVREPKSALHRQNR